MALLRILLYNLESDVDERDKLASSMPEKLAKLKKVLNVWRKKVKAPIPTELNPKFNPNHKKEMK